MVLPESSPRVQLDIYPEGVPGIAYVVLPGIPPISGIPLSVISPDIPPAFHEGILHTFLLKFFERIIPKFFQVLIM